MYDMRMSIGILLATAVACALLCGPTSCQEGGAADAWYDPPPPGFASVGNGRAVESAAVSAHRDEAEKALEKDSIRPLSQADLDYYAPGRTAASPEGSPFLVRGLAGFEGTGGFSFYQRGEDLLVLHVSLGSYMPRLKRRPLVVWLPKEPRHVYVDINVAQ